MQSALNVVAWASLPFALRDLLRIVFMLSTGHAILSPGLSGFVSTPGFLAELLARLDIFLIWNVVLLALGLGITDSLPRGKALAGVANVIATDILPHRVEAAKRFGANHAFLTAEGSHPEAIWVATDGRGVDVAFEAAGRQEAVDDAVAAVRPGGKVILAGIPDDDRTSFSASIARRKGLTIKLVRRMKHTYPRAIDLVTKGLVEVRSLVTHRFPLDQALEAFHTAARREGLKVIIEI
jgi:Zn-dependent alcohol dehydrogenase